MVRKIFTYTREEQKMNPGTLNSRVDENPVIAEERTGAKETISLPVPSATSDELKESNCKGQVEYVLPSSEEEVEPSKLSESLSVTEEEDFPIYLEAIIVSCCGCFHGRTLAVILMSCDNNDATRGFGPLLDTVSASVSIRGKRKSKNIQEFTPQPTMPPPSVQPSQDTVSASVSTRGKRKSKNIPESTPQPTMPPPSVQPSQDQTKKRKTSRRKEVPLQAKNMNVPIPKAYGTQEREAGAQGIQARPIQARNKTRAGATKTKTITECKSPTIRSMTSKQGAVATKTRVGATKTKPNTVRPIWK
ncbi:hypothetical protein IFM89_009482 [Coptis chinensis]|uniref:Uncharacterized protein n=1 Tax=Coptis chinensis TaxID=261450 RepID=A0A835LU77_9MAGN|nr:hypothetical protein IFM89_009482 [Coptis chinensis]